MTEREFISNEAVHLAKRAIEERVSLEQLIRTITSVYSYEAKELMRNLHVKIKHSEIYPFKVGQKLVSEGYSKIGFLIKHEGGYYVNSKDGGLIEFEIKGDWEDFDDWYAKQPKPKSLVGFLNDALKMKV